MALFISGMKCPLCGQEIGSGQERELFRPFVRNARDPLYVFSDSVVHSSCLNHDSRYEQLQTILAELTRAKNACLVCGERVLSASDGCVVDCITSDVRHPLFKYNFTRVHWRHVSEWPDWPEFSSLATALQSSEDWEGTPLLPEWVR